MQVLTLRTRIKSIPKVSCGPSKSHPEGSPIKGHAELVQLWLLTEMSNRIAHGKIPSLNFR